MEKARRKLEIILLVGISLTILAAPARGDDWFGVQLGRGGFSLSFGSSNWAVYGSSWSDPGWRIDYHTALSGYGEWVWVEGLGQSWRPWVAPGWRPYTYGRWVWTRLGWTWVAYEPWGYFPHHYGNWALSTYGWVWTPGYQYRPANVIWVGAGGFVGWYACPPAGWSHSRRGWQHGQYRGYASGYDDGYSAGWHDAEHATYTQWRHFGADDLSRHAVPYKAARDGGWSPTAIRPGAAAPDRDDLNRRGIVTPQMEIESRMVRIGDRQVELARPMGAQPVIRRNAEPTLQRALAENAQRTAVARERAARTAPTERGRGADTTAAPPQSAPHRPETTRRRDPSPDRPEPARSAQPKAGSRQPSSAGGPTKTASVQSDRGSDRARATHQAATKGRTHGPTGEASTAISRSSARSQDRRHDTRVPVGRLENEDSARRARPAADTEREAPDDRQRRSRRDDDRRQTRPGGRQQR